MPGEHPVVATARLHDGLSVRRKRAHADSLALGAISEVFDALSPIRGAFTPNIVGVNKPSGALKNETPGLYL